MVLEDKLNQSQIKQFQNKLSNHDKIAYAKVNMNFAKSESPNSRKIDKYSDLSVKYFLAAGFDCEKDLRFLLDNIFELSDFLLSRGDYNNSVLLHFSILRNVVIVSEVQGFVRLIKVPIIYLLIFYLNMKLK